MCKSKKRLSNSVTSPSTMARKSTSSLTPNKSHKSSSSSEQLQSSSSNYNSIPSTGSSYYLRDSWATTTSNSNSGKIPLSKLRDNLPEQPHIYDVAEISAATSTFSLKPFSSSSTSTSWQCTIRGQEVMLIQRKFRRRQINISELGERLGVICRSHHSSFVKLKGAAIGNNSKYIYLVYEYVNGGNLGECLRNKKNPNFTVLSSWISRLKIAQEIAHGLDYIHHSTGLGRDFLHNHIKSSSIIITESLDPKICHFGTADLCGEIQPTADENSPNSKKTEMKVEGTRGYMAPEFTVTGAPSEKTDVYAFGVVLLELLSGREAMKYRFDEEWGGYVRESVIETATVAVTAEGGGVRRWVDGRVKDSYPVEVAERLVRLGLECVGEDPGRRPDMGRVVGRISQLYLESQKWVERMGEFPADFSVSLAPR